MALIFAFSAQTAQSSSETSGSLIEQGQAFLFRGFEDMPAYQQQEIVESLQFIVRKGAHFSVYALLGMLCLPPAYVGLRKRKYAAWTAWSAAALYAVFDEIHQYFVPGRSCEIRDMLIDSAGAAVGILLVLGIWRIVRKARRVKYQKNTAV